MSAKVTVFCLLFVLSDAWALQEPPIYYDRNYVLPEELSEQNLECWGQGGICTPLGNCPSGHILNLAALGELCGETGTSVCCTHFPTHDDNHVAQVGACNAKQAFCAWNSDCPPESRLEGDLCGGQEDVSCCRTGLAKKRSLGLPAFFSVPSGVRSTPQKGFIKLRASGTMNALPEQLEAGGAGGAGGAGRAVSKFTVDAVSIAKKNAQGSSEDGGDVETTSPALPASFGAVEKSRGHEITEENCHMKGGLCVPREHCPPADQLGHPDLCGFQNFFACCQASHLTRPRPDVLQIE